jgi:hypothetical protein
VISVTLLQVILSRSYLFISHMPRCAKSKRNCCENEGEASIESLGASFMPTIELEEQQYDRSYKLLACHRLKHKHWRPNFTAENWRQKLSECVSVAMNRLIPHNWQLDIAEALKYKLDCLVLAGTGAGKTLPFVLNLLMDKNLNHKIVILSPLIELQFDQVSGSKSDKSTLASVSARSCVLRKWAFERLPLIVKHIPIIFIRYG